MPGRFTFRTRVFLLCSALVVCVVAWGLWWLAEMRKDMVRQAAGHLARELPLIRELLEARQAQWESAISMDSLADWLGAGLQVRVTFVLPNGIVVGDSQVEFGQIALLDNHGDRPEVREALRTGSGSSVRYSHTLGTELLYLAALIGEPASGMVVRLALPLEEVSSVVNKGYGFIIVAMLTGLLLSFLTAHLVARTMGRELGELAKKAREITQERDRQGDSQVSEMGALDRALKALGSDLASKIRELEEARDGMATLIQGMIEGVLFADEEGKILLVNKALRNCLEPRVDPIGKTVAEAFRLADLQEVIDKCVTDGQISSVEMRTSGASPRILEVQVAPVKGRGAVAVFHDVTERKRVEEMRRDLVASASHELRTPVAAVRASAETLLEEALEDPVQVRRFAEIIHRHSLRLQKILEDLLELSRLEHGVASPKRRPVRLQELAQAGLEAVTELARAKGLALCHEPTQEEITVEGDQRQLEQALINLLENAVNYTEPGGRVCLRINVEKDEVHVAVEDTGMGIPPEHLPRIFERFYRVDKNRSRAMGGTGLGLSIVKNVVQSHGGRVEVDSTPGKGSVFKIILPRLVPSR